jgi:hypothetical protein
LGKLCADHGTEALKPYEALTAKAQRGDNIESPAQEPDFGIMRLADQYSCPSRARHRRDELPRLGEETRDKLQNLPSHD